MSHWRKGRDAARATNGSRYGSRSWACELKGSSREGRAVHRFVEGRAEHLVDGHACSAIRRDRGNHSRCWGNRRKRPHVVGCKLLALRVINTSGDSGCVDGVVSQLGRRRERCNHAGVRDGSSHGSSARSFHRKRRRGERVRGHRFVEGRAEHLANGHTGSSIQWNHCCHRGSRGNRRKAPHVVGGQRSTCYACCPGGDCGRVKSAVGQIRTRRKRRSYAAVANCSGHSSSARSGHAKGGCTDRGRSHLLAEGCAQYLTNGHICGAVHRNRGYHRGRGRRRSIGRKAPHIVGDQRRATHVRGACRDCRGVERAVCERGSRRESCR
jgi:hypothetical protein